MPDRAAYSQPEAQAALHRLRASPLNQLSKGFGGLPAGISVTAQDLVTAEASITGPQFSTPLMVLRESALEHNIQSMAQFCARSGVVLAPHAKTTMSPEIFTRQLSAGAWGLTAANPSQAAVFAHFGARRILIANEVTDPAAIGQLASLLASLPGLELCCYADSVPGVDALEAGLEKATGRPGRVFPVLLEYGVPGGRTGVRSHEEAMMVAERISQSSSLGLVGVSCFEGVLGHGVDDASVSSVARLCATVRELGEELSERGYVRHGMDGSPLGGPALVLSAGGSHYFDVVATQFRRSQVPATTVVLRSGSYVAHDHGIYRDSTPAVRDSALPSFVPAIEIHATVLSRPEPGLLLLNAGRRDVSFDAGFPVVLGLAGAGRAGAGMERLRVSALNDQHAFVEVPTSSPLSVGDRVRLGISHPCTTFDRWQAAVIADDCDRVTGIAHTFF